MKKLIIVRHGQAEHHIKNITGGWTDLPLTELGRKQALNTGHSLLHILEGLDYKFYSSDLLRAAETAQIISGVLSKKPVYSPELRELNNGVAANLLKEEAKKIRLSKKDEHAIDWIPYPEAESWRMMDTRIRSFMDSIDKLEDDTVLLVTHANSIIAMVDWLLEIKDDDSIARIMYDADPCSITILGVDNDGCKKICKLNDSSHLVELTDYHIKTIEVGA